MKAEGGIERIVWMPKELKEFVAHLLDRSRRVSRGDINLAKQLNVVTTTQLACGRTERSL